ncbi:MAG: GGDEF domain-containing protein [Oceanidesulfovibrio sp.]
MTFLLMLLDIDHFQRFNDNYGHRIGDQVIMTFANKLKEYSEVLSYMGNSPFNPARYGGEEFAVILPGIEADSARTPPLRCWIS